MLLVGLLLAATVGTENAILVDLHADTLHRIVHEGRHPGIGFEAGPDRQREGGPDVQFYAIWVPPGVRDPAATAAAEISAFRRMLREAGPGLEQARTVADVRRIVSEGRKAAMLGLEGGAALRGNPDALRDFWRDGVRYMSPTWNEACPFGAGANARGLGGLTPKGRRLVALMNELGIIPDVSHASEETFWDVVAQSRGPVIASHTDAASLCPHRRNIDDIQAWAIAESGGVIGVAFHAPFLRTGPGRASIDDVASHIAHFVKVAGASHVALGSDFDGGIRTPLGLSDASRIPDLAVAFAARGLTSEEIRAILGENVLRVLEETERRHPDVRVTHRPVATAVVAASVDRDRARYAVDKNTRTAWVLRAPARAVGQFIEVRPVRGGVDRVSLCSAGPDGPGGVRSVRLTVRCDASHPELTAAVTLTDEVRPHRVSLPALPDCRRPRVRIEISSVTPGAKIIQLSEIVIESKAIKNFFDASAFRVYPRSKVQRCRIAPGFFEVPQCSTRTTLHWRGFVTPIPAARQPS